MPRKTPTKRQQPEIHIPRQVARRMRDALSPTLGLSENSEAMEVDPQAEANEIAQSLKSIRSLIHEATRINTVDDLLIRQGELMEAIHKISPICSHEDSIEVVKLLLELIFFRPGPVIHYGLAWLERFLKLRFLHLQRKKIPDHEIYRDLKTFRGCFADVIDGFMIDKLLDVFGQDPKFVDLSEPLVRYYEFVETSTEIQFLCVLLAKLASKGTSASQKMLHDMANRDKKLSSKLNGIMRNDSTLLTIFRYLVNYLHHEIEKDPALGKENAEKALGLLCQWGQIASLEDIVSKSLPVLCFHLLDNLSSCLNVTQVLLPVVISSSYEANTYATMNSEEMIVGFATTYFHGYLAMFQSRFGLHEVKGRHEALKSLALLIGAISSDRVNEFAFLIIEILKSITSDSVTEVEDVPFAHLTFGVWGKLLQILTPVIKKEKLVDILSSLTEFVLINPAQTATIFEQLLADCSTEKLREVHFLVPRHHPEFQPLMNEIDNKLQLTGEQDGRTFTNHIITHIGYLENQVSNHAYLEQGLTHLFQYINAGDLDEILASRILQRVVSLCKTKNEDNRAILGKLIGSMSAFRPSSKIIFERDRLSDPENLTKHIIVSNGEYMRDLFTRLGRNVFRCVETNCIAFAIQQLLKSYMTLLNLPTTERVAALLPEEVKRQVAPYLNSSFVYQGAPEGSLTDSVFRPGVSFTNWIDCWGYTLVLLLPADSPERFVYESLQPAMSSDVRLYELILPQILISLLTKSDACIKSFLLEVDAVTKTTREQSSEMDRQLTCTEKPTNMTEEPPRAYEGEDGEEEEVACQTNLTSSHRRSLTRDEERQKCAQLMFSLIDKINQWIAYMRSVKAPQDKFKKEHGHAIKLLESLNEKQYDLALLAFHCKDYARSLRFLEGHIRHKNGVLGEGEPPVLWQKLYYVLDDCDSVTGVYKVRKGTPSVNEEIVKFEAERNFDDALTCARDSLDSDNVETVKTFTRCLLNVGDSLNAFHLTEREMDRKSVWKGHLYPLHIEAAKNLNKWDEVHECLTDFRQMELTPTFTTNVAQLLSIARAGKSVRKFEVASSNAYALAVSSLAMSNIGNNYSYPRVYPYILHLHLLYDIELASRVLIGEAKSSQDIRLVLDKITDREKRLEPSESTFRESFGILQPLISLIKSTAQYREDPSLATFVDSNYARSLITTCKIARKSGGSSLNRATIKELKGMFYANSPNGSAISDPSLFGDFITEEAKYYLLKNQADVALTHLENVQSLIGDPYNDPDKKKLLARIQLLTGKICEREGSLRPSDVIKLYQESNNLNASGKAAFHLAKCHDSLFSYSDYSNYSNSEDAYQAVRCYYVALDHGRNIIEALSRFLTIWFELSKQCIDEEAKMMATASSKRHTSDTARLGEKQKKLNKINGLVRDKLVRLPATTLMSCCSQMIPQLGQELPATADMVVLLVSKLFESFPHQIIWMLLPLLKTDQQGNKRRAGAEKLVNNVLSRSPRQRAFFTSYDHFAQIMLKLAKLLQNESRVSRQNIDLNPFRDDIDILKRFFLSRPNIMLPLQKSMLSISESVDYRHYLIDLVHPTFEIMSSLQRPMKLKFKCGNGRDYTILFKANDDLRKDQRLIEFVNLVNQFLGKNVASVNRHLQMKTYATTPVNETCGLIEWIDNLTTFRSIAQSFYGAANVDTGIKKMAADKNVVAKTRKSRFKTALEWFKPPVLHQWFNYNFTSPSSWFRARLNFSRSLALSSMVGYICGLGDRHPENVLIDFHSGIVVHVDFNMLFNAGEMSAIPELVPFRLTHNLVDGLGPLGVEGNFRKSCEVSLEVMRQKKDPLMSVMLPFIFDPCSEWLKERDQMRERSTTDQWTLRNALMHIENIRARLTGVPVVLFLIAHPLSDPSAAFNYISSPNNPYRLMQHVKPISVQGQVQFLIKQALSEDNIGPMFCGWSGFL